MAWKNGKGDQERGVLFRPLTFEGLFKILGKVGLAVLVTVCVMVVPFPLGIYILLTISVIVLGFLYDPWGFIKGIVGAIFATVAIVTGFIGLLYLISS